MHKIVSKNNFKCPSPTKLDPKSVVDKLLFEPLPVTIAKMESSGYVAAEYRRRHNMAIYDSRLTSDTDSLDPMPMFKGDLTDVANMRYDADASIRSKVADASAKSDSSSSESVPSEGSV